MSDWKAKLKEAKELLDLGLIEPEEFAEIKAAAIAAMKSTSPPSATPSTVPPQQVNPLSGATIVDNVPPPSVNTGGGLSGATIVGTVDQVDAQSRFLVGSVLGQHRIVSVLGEGGMGQVFKARHKLEAYAEQEGDVAIKMMHAHYAEDEQFKNRFIREASLGKKINHPNIANVHHVYTEPLALVLDYVDGDELSSLIPEQGLPLSQVLSYLRPIAEALDHLHQHEIIHRDIKPANIKINSAAVPMLLDFGIAKDASRASTMTKTSMAMGTEAYMAPEQMNAKHVGPAADQYALAMTVYECLCGQLPWGSEETAFQVGMRKMSADFVPLSSYRSDLPAGLEQILLRGLSMKVEGRFENCLGFVDALSGLERRSETDVDDVLDARMSQKETRERNSSTSQGRQSLSNVERQREESWGTHGVWVSSGRFMMGALPSDGDAGDDEKPRHEVVISQDMIVMKYPVTQKVYEGVMGNNPSESQGLDRPVENVSWVDAVKFANALSERCGLEPAYEITESGWLFKSIECHCNWESNGWRLPTDAEWEYLARGGEEHLYAGSDDIDSVAWYRDNSGKKTHPVGQKQANGFGLYDMSGNVFEWCWDGSKRDYSSGSVTDPRGPSSGSYRVLRGGSWLNDARVARASLRLNLGPARRDRLLGFRLLRKKI